MTKSETGPPLLTTPFGVSGILASKQMPTYGNSALLTLFLTSSGLRSKKDESAPDPE